MWPISCAQITPSLLIHAIKLLYSKTDQLVGIEAGEALTPELQDKLSRAVAEALLAPAG